MLQELAKLLNNEKETINQSDINNKDSKTEILSIKEIDEILINAWEVSINQTEFSKAETDRGLNASHTIGYVKGIATAIRNRAYLLMLQSEYKKSLDDSRLCLNLLDDDEYLLAGTAWDIISLSYNGLALYEKSVEATYKSLPFFEKAEYERGKAWAHHNLAMVYRNIGDLEKSEAEYLKALRMFETLQHKEGLGRVNSLLSQIYQKTREYDKAMESLERAMLYIKKDEVSIQSYSIFMNRAITFRLMGDYNRSAEEFRITSNIITRYDNAEMESQYEYEIGLLYKDEGDLDEAIEHLFSAYDLAQKMNIRLLIKDITHAISDVNEQRGELKTALNFFRIYDKILRELTNNDTLQRIHSMELQKDIELAEKEKDYHQRLQEETEKILKNVLPVAIVDELKTTGHVKPKRIPSATALFTDFVGFTAMSSRISPEEIVTELDYCFSGFDKIMDDLGIEKLKTIGDGYMAVAGSLGDTVDHTELCVKAGLRIPKFMEDYIAMRNKQNKESWNVRIGIHSGPLIAGVIGSNKFAYDVWGDTVNIASRIESGGNVGKVNVSSQVYELIKNNFSCSFSGEVDAKGKGLLSIYTVER